MKKIEGYNKERKLIYVGIPKTGSQTFSKLLQVGNPYSGNKALDDFYVELGDEIVHSCLKVASVRNPYDRLYSLYKYSLISTVKNFEGYIKYLEDNSNTIKNFDTQNCINVKKIYKSIRSLGLISMTNYIKHPKFSVDTILHLENVEEYSKNIFEIMEMPVDVNLKLNTSKPIPEEIEHKKNPKYIKIINDLYYKDFVNFKYDMIVE